MKNIKRLFLCGFAAFTLASCGGGGGSSSSGSGGTLGISLKAPSPTATAGDTLVTISWTSVSGASSYNIYWSTSSTVSKSTGTRIANAASPYNHTGRANGTTYYYVLTSVSGSTESADSAVVSATPLAPPAPPQ